MAAPSPNTLGHRIMSARKRRRIRRVELARALKMSVTALGHIEQGTMPPPHRDVIHQIAHVLGVRPDELLGVTDASGERDEPPRAVIVVGSI